MAKENLYSCYRCDRWNRKDNEFMAIFDVKITDKNISFHRGLTGYDGYGDNRIMDLKRITKEIVIAHNINNQDYWNYKYTKQYDWDDFLFYIGQAGVPYNFIKIDKIDDNYKGWAWVKYDREKKYFITNTNHYDLGLDFRHIKLTNDEWFGLAKMKDGQGFYKEKITWQ